MTFHTMIQVAAPEQKLLNSPRIRIFCSKETRHVVALKDKAEVSISYLKSLSRFVFLHDADFTLTQ